MNKLVAHVLILFLFLGITQNGFSQNRYMLNLATLSGQKVNKANLHAFTIMNSTNRSQLLIVKGAIKMRSNRSTLNYRYQATLKPGANHMTDLARSVTYTYSSSSMEKLFKQHGMLPNGEYEYCVDLYEPGGEGADALSSDCIYDENQDLFFINLMDPEDKAKISELYPMFSWTVNSPLINELTYKIRVAEIKDGQRPNNAIMRNRPVYEQGGLRFPTQNYPVTAKSLEYFTPYAWTVDAYYRDILMGSAETWQFVIINDSLMAGVPNKASYVEVNRETGAYPVFAIGKLKLKYYERELRSQTLKFELSTNDGKSVKLKQNSWAVHRGENRTEVMFTGNNVRMKHLKLYKLKIISGVRSYNILFKYINPDFI